MFQKDIDILGLYRLRLSRWVIYWFLLITSIWGQKDDIGSGFIIGIVSSDEGPLIGVQVWIEELGIGDVTDSMGKYQLGPLNEGEYRVIFWHIGYKEVVSDPIEVVPKKKSVLNIVLVPEPVEMEEVLVTPKEEYFDPTGVTASLTTRMIQESPGAAQDIFLVLQTLPGISSAGDDSKLFVRGGKPEENLILYDGATIQNPFHFDFIGGGFYTIFNSSLVDKVEFYSGGFPARYGDKLSAVMVIENREGSRDKRGIELSLSMADVKILVESPLSSTATTILTFRRSYFDLLLGETGFGGRYDLLPFFYDVNSKTDIFLTTKHRLSLNLLYSREKMSGYFDEPHWVGTHTWSSNAWTTSLRLRSLLSQNLTSDLNLYWSEGYHKASHADGIGIENTRQGEIAMKEDISLFLEAHELHLGVWLVEDRSDMEIGLPLDLAYNFEEMYYKSKGSATKLAAYVEDTWDVSHWLSLNYGIRIDHIGPSSETILSPRLNTVITPGSNFQLSINYGLYTQSPTAYELKNNRLQRSRQSRAWGMGINRRMDDIYWSLEVYKKQLSYLMTLDSLGKFSDNGKGNASGVELYIQKKMGDKFTGWASFTYSVAKRKEGTAMELALFDYDQTYMMTAVGQYRLSMMWKVSFRFRYATGRPYTPAKGGWFDTTTGRYFPVVGKRNSSRYPPYHRLDFRISRYFPDILDGLIVYFETINTYNRDNVVYYIWSDDFSDTRNFTVFPFMPILGIDVTL